MVGKRLLKFPKPIKRFKKPHKYGAQKTIIDGIEFASKLEASVYRLLQYREKAGELKDIKLQTSVRLKEKCEMCGAGSLTWKVDFSATEVKTGHRIYIEAKGAETANYLKRKQIWKTEGPGPLEIWKGSCRYPRLVETIHPKKARN